MEHGALREPEGDVASPVLLDTADVPGGKLRLLRRGEDYEILFGDEQLMGSWCFRSEQALANLAIGRLDGRAERVLIGGLGMGFTLAAALKALPPTATVVVAEVVPEVVAWASGPLAHIVGDSLNDDRVTLAVRDIHDVIAEARDAFDVILLDVDNGPDGLISPANERIYCDWGLRDAHAALRAGGALGVWSAQPDDDFADRLARAHFDVEEVTVDVDSRDEGQPHVIWIATRSTGDASLGG